MVCFTWRYKMPVQKTPGVTNIPYIGNPFAGFGPVQEETPKDDWEEWYSNNIESGARKYAAAGNRDYKPSRLGSKRSSNKFSGHVPATKSPRTEMEIAGVVVPELMRGHDGETSIDEVLSLGGFQISSAEDRVNAYRAIGYLLEDFASEHGLEVRARVVGNGVYELIEVVKMPHYNDEGKIVPIGDTINPIQYLGVFRERYLELCALGNNVHPLGSLGIEQSEEGTKIYFAISEKHREELKYNPGETIKFRLRLTSSNVNDTVRQ